MIGTLGKPNNPANPLGTDAPAAQRTPLLRWGIPDARALLDRARSWSVPSSTGVRTPALTLELPERTIRVRSPKVLELLLAGRTQFPVKRLMRCMDDSPSLLEWKSERMRDTERRLSALLTRSLQQPEVLGEELRELGVRAISKDHGWRDIMDILMRLGPDHDEYKRVALVKYLQYLRSRQRALKGIFVDKTQDTTTAGLHATALHDDVGDEHATGVPMRTLPKGETVRIRLPECKVLRLNLAGNPFRLEAGPHCTLIDNAGTRLPLRPGKNVVGRDAGCEVVVDPACRAVSRRHLVLEPLGEDEVLVTDVSAHGTQLPAEFL